MRGLPKEGLQNKRSLRNTLTPVVIESSAGQERAYDIYSRLLKDRIIFISDEITDDMASAIIAQMLFLKLDSKEDDISIYIMSPGGSIPAAMAIYDTMQHIPNQIATYCIGQACSAAAFILAAGSKGKRFALPSSRIMIHQPWQGMQGTASDIEIAAKELQSVKESIYQKMAFHTGKDIKQIATDCDRDFFMSAEEAKEYGLVDDVVAPSKASFKKKR